VEDETALLDMYRDMLELAGYSVLYTRDGEVSAKICEEHSSEIDLLLSDMMIPGKSGANLSLFIHDRWPQIKILLFSGHPDTEKTVPRLDADRDRVRFCESRSIRTCCSEPSIPCSTDLVFRTCVFDGKAGHESMAPS
jgi:response regulator RpfG family c-di-GMP phosphodiesterase